MRAVILKLDSIVYFVVGFQKKCGLLVLFETK